MAAAAAEEGKVGFKGGAAGVRCAAADWGGLGASAKGTLPLAYFARSMGCMARWAEGLEGYGGWCDELLALLPLV